MHLPTVTILFFDEGDLTYLVLIMLITFLGTIWMFLHASEHINPLVAFMLVAFNLWVFIQSTFPFILAGYFLFWAIGLSLHTLSARRELKRLEKLTLPPSGIRIGVKRSVDPTKQVEELGLPSIYGKAEVATSEKLTTIPELEELLADGKVEEALRLAEERWEQAKASGDDEIESAYRSYIERIQKGEW